MRKRGRPKISYNKLQNKRAIDVKIEPLDLCLKKNFINNSQHKIGIRYRWLYTLRYGLPTIQSVSIALKDEVGRTIKMHDEKWLKHKEKEYNNIVSILKDIRLEKLVSKICIHNIMPDFLLVRASKSHVQYELEKFKFAMGELERFYKKQI